MGDLTSYNLLGSTQVAMYLTIHRESFLPFLQLMKKEKLEKDQKETSAVMHYITVLAVKHREKTQSKAVKIWKIRREGAGYSFLSRTTMHCLR